MTRRAGDARRAPRLADALARYVTSELEALARGHLPDFEIPRSFAGHAVAPDVRADLLFTLGHLRSAGVAEIAGRPVDRAIAEILRPVDGPGTHTFFSYRVAETVAQFGAFEGNALLRGFDAAQRRNVAEACDSTAFAKLVETGKMPRNYAAVLARCEAARERLGLLEKRDLLDDMTKRTADLLGENPAGYLDDSNSGIARYDIYTADVYLFTEPLAARLGETWRRGFESALELVRRTLARNGAAVSWGRSTGALGTCLTVELGALAVAEGLTPEPGWWLAAAAHAFARMPAWIEGGLTTAHRRRSPYAYRGPQRRLQMSLDLLGKLAYASATLRRAPAEIEAADAADLFPARSEWIAFDVPGRTGVWAHRSRDLAFVVPVVGPTRSDYLPAPRNPDLFEVPVDSELACGVPYALRHGVRFAAAGIPQAAEFSDDRLRLEYRGFPRTGSLEADPDAPVLDGRRRVTMRAAGRTLVVEEELEFSEPPHGVALQVAEARHRPLRVEFESDAPHRVTCVETDGLSEWRSFWSELPRVHQVDLEPARRLRLRWSVTPRFRVATTELQHHYHRSLYDPLSSRVHEEAFPRAWVGDPRSAEDLLSHSDFFHLHWPEWIWGPDLGAHQRFIEALRGHAVKIVWTQHNLLPHRKDPGFEAIYRAWAAAADAAIHHSRWGERVMRERYPYGPQTVHRVIPHGHFGNLMPGAERLDRRALEEELGLAPAAIRIGVVGAPRAEKKTQTLMEAFAATRRDDLGLLVLCAGPEDRVPDDPRIRALPYEMVPREVFNRRLATLDLLAIPIEGADRGEGYLTTGQFADAVGLGLPALASDWAFLREMLGDAAICYGRGHDDLRRTLEALDPEQVARAAAASKALQPRYDWSRLAETTHALLEELGTDKL